jgi:hypothetical protein
MRRRGEIVEMVLAPGNHRDSDSQGSRPKDARKDGHIRSRSRWLIHMAG